MKLNKKSKQNSLTNERGLDDRILYNENGIKGKIYQVENDSVHIIMEVINQSSKDILIPKNFPTKGTSVYFSLPDESIYPSFIGGGTGKVLYLSSGESYSYHLRNYELTLASFVNAKTSGWYNIIWKMEKLDISESIRVYYDYDKMKKKLHLRN